MARLNRRKKKGEKKVKTACSEEEGENRKYLGIQFLHHVIQKTFLI